MPRRGFGQLIGWAAVATMAAYCLFWGGGWAATYYLPYRIWALVPAFAGVGIWIALAIRNPPWRPRTVLAPAFAAAFAAFTICTITSRQPRFSTEYLSLAILLIALYLILQRLMASEFFRPRMIGFAAIAGVVVGVAYVATVVPQWIKWWELIGHLAAPPLRPFFDSLTFGNPSAVMTASVLLAVPAVAQLSGGSRVAKVAASGIIALALIITVLSGSRAGWLAIGIATVLVSVLWLVAPDHRAALASLAGSRAAKILALLVVTFAIVMAFVVGPGLALRASSGGESLRTSFYATAIRMFESSPLVGTGPGNWVPQRIAYTLTSESDFYIPHAHNIYLQTLAELGIVGALAGFVVVAALARLIFGATQDLDPRRRRMGWATLFATIYFGAHQLLDFYANAPAILLAFAIPIAWLDATAPASAGLIFRRRTWTLDKRSRVVAAAKVAGVGLIVASAVYQTWSERGALLMNDGTNLLDDGKASHAVGPLIAAANLDPAMTPYHFALGLALAQTGNLTGAEEQFSLAAKMDDLPEAWLDLAAVRARLGRRVEAREALIEAARLGTQQAGVAMGVGIVQLQLGDTDAATSSFAIALGFFPTLAGDPWWMTEPARALIWPDIYRLAFEKATAASRFTLALETGDTSAALDSIGAIADEEVAATSRIVLRAWSGDREAFSHLQARARERPLDLVVISWCAILARRSGDREQAANYATWAETVEGLASLEGWEVRVANGQKTDRDVGINTLFYGQYTYRRPVPLHQLVSGLPELVYQ